MYDGVRGRQYVAEVKRTVLMCMMLVFEAVQINGKLFLRSDNVIQQNQIVVACGLDLIRMSTSFFSHINYLPSHSCFNMSSLPCRRSQLEEAVK